MIALLKELDETLSSAGAKPVHLVTIGGASMLSRIPGRQTNDIDVISEGLSREARQAIEVVGLRHGLGAYWINDGVKAFAVDVDLELERIFTGACLTVDTVGPRYLLATKLLAGRCVDRDDCVHLIREVSIKSDTELLDLMQTAAKGRQLRPRDEYWAKEMFGLAYGRRAGNRRKDQ